MKYEHLVEVNDASSPLVEALTREQLWFGLLCRAEDPRPFLPGLEACEIVARSATGLRRVLRFGQAAIHDRVSFADLNWIRFESEATAEHAGGSLTISIEEPQAGALFLRFRYVTSLPEDAVAGEGQYTEFVKSAYRESDIDTLRVIRLIAEARRQQ